MTDLLGFPLSIGARIVYTTGAQSNTRLEIGEIVDIESRAGWHGGGEAALIRTASGRKAANWRAKHELMSLQFISEHYPELEI